VVVVVTERLVALRGDIGMDGMGGRVAAGATLPASAIASDAAPRCGFGSPSTLRPAPLQRDCLRARKDGQKAFRNLQVPTRRPEEPPQVSPLNAIQRKLSEVGRCQEELGSHARHATCSVVVN
jgi:hypothetical protein